MVVAFVKVGGNQVQRSDSFLGTVLIIPDSSVAAILPFLL